jgi:8-oxo-dGTP diphosphatase
VQTPDGERLMILLVHRTKQKDVSFPKGKLDPGESMPQAAVRETLEETGLVVSLGVNLGTITYQLPSGDDRKTVQYWAAEVTESAVEVSTFKPNGEISALEWALLDEVPSRLTYKADRDLFKVFAQLAERDAIDTFSVIMLRHAKAVARSELWPEDRLRPLSDIGEDQAETIVPSLEAFGPVRILTSNTERCMRTVAPLAHHLHKTVRVNEGLGQDAWDAGETDDLRKAMGKVVRKGKSIVICTHRPVLPDAVRELALATGSLPGSYLDDAAALPPGAFSVFHLSRKHPGAGILSVETYPLKH